MKLIHAGHIIPVRPANVVWSDHCVVDAKDLVKGLIPFAQAVETWPEAEITHLPEHILIPGLN